MLIIPAIDLRGGQCVRLFKGDFGQETVYSADPVEVARRWHREGAPWLHLVDLDGARLGQPQQLDLVGKIAAAVPIPVQLGGGLRQESHIQAALDAGVARCILGTVALEDPGSLARLIDRFGEALAVAIDFRGDYAALRGWLDTGELTALELARRVADLGCRRIVATAVERDGTLEGPDLGRLTQLAALPVKIIASGGIGTVAHLEALARLQPPVEGAITGKALYQGTITLAQALAAATRRSFPCWLKE